MQKKPTLIISLLCYSRKLWSLHKTEIDWTSQGEEKTCVQTLTCMLPGVSAGQWQPAAVWPPPQSPAHQQNTERGPYGLDVPSLTEGCWACLQLLSVKLTKERIPHSHPSPDIIQTTSHPYSANSFYILKCNNEWRAKRKSEQSHQRRELSEQEEAAENEKRITAGVGCRTVTLHCTHSGCPYLLIHSSCVLQRSCQHWVSERWSTTPRGNTGTGSYKPLVTPFLSADQYIILFNVCLCLKTHNWIYSVDSLTLNSQPGAL